MEFDELVLSEVHFNTNNEQPVKQITRSGCKIFLSRFLIRLPHEIETEEQTKGPAVIKDALQKLDEDGDLIVTRKKSDAHNIEVIVIEHTLSSQLHLVGLQVWLGSLLLSDYILYKDKEFENCTALELGAGVGLCSIIMARVAKTVFCTDVDESILDTCQTNSNRNSHFYKQLLANNNQNQKDRDVIRIRQLDWTKELICPGNGDPYSWTSEDQLLLQECSLLLAADVVYDNKLTAAFFQTIHSLMRFPPLKTLFIAIEKRLNFTLSDLDVSCAEYDFFIDCLNQMQQESFDDLMLFTSSQVATDFPSFLQDVYKRSPFLELWKVVVSFKSKAS